MEFINLIRIITEIDLLKILIQNKNNNNNNYMIWNFWFVFEQLSSDWSPFWF